MRGRPCRVVGRKGIETSLLKILDAIPLAQSLSSISGSLEQLADQTYANALMYDYISMLQTIVANVCAQNSHLFSRIRHSIHTISQYAKLPTNTWHVAAGGFDLKRHLRPGRP